MALSVNPLTHVIYVPKADLTLIQANPEVRELNLNAFRLELKDWEDGEEGIPQLKTHDHNTEVTLSGLTYARIIEILSPYTVEFEDGQYTINCVGANHNLADVKISNQVSLIVNNAAGLINNQAIEFSSFNGGVTINPLSSNVGTIFPTGTPQKPVNNFADAKIIADTRGFNKFFIIGNATLDSGDNVENFTIEGDGVTRTTITVLPGALTQNVDLVNATVTGVFDIEGTFKNCRIVDISFVQADIYDCVLLGEIILTGSGTTSIYNCKIPCPNIFCISDY